MSVLTPFREAGWLGPLDVRFALAMARAVGETADDVLLGAAAASAALSHGHTCLELGRADELLAVGSEDAPDPGEVSWPPSERWRAALQGSRLVGDGLGPEPLVIEGERLYLNRYWDYQRRLVTALAERARRTLPARGRDRVAAALGEAFPAGSDPDQRRVAEVAIQQALTLVSGGPGTGKTATVVRVLAMLMRGDPKLRVALVAPTGKAAARMSEAIRDAKAHADRFGVDAALLAPVAEQASTIHRALGWQPFAKTRFRHDAANPLPVDVVVADEASMMDLALMTKLVEAVPASARLLVLGDRDQLASVDAGRVFGDLCTAASAGAVGACYVQLKTTHRFKPDSGIARLARAINDGDGDAALEALRAGGDVTWIGHDTALVRDALVGGWRDAVSATEPGPALEAQGRFRVLCAHRRGTWAAEKLNEKAREWLAADGAISPSYRAHYKGLPVMVTRNDRALDLSNGDVGVVLPSADDDGLRVWFPSSGPDKVRDLSPALLPEHQPCYAMTVHKAQGSGFDEVLVVLPEKASPITTRELLYTAVTRAKKRVTVVASEDVVRHAVATQVVRASGLADALARAGASTTASEEDGR